MRLVLTFVTFVLTEFSKLLTVITLLLTVKTAPVFGIAVNKDPSPTNLAKIVPAEIVEKNPYVVDIELAEILEAVKKLVLTVFALITAGIAKLPPPPPGTFVREEPSPTNLA